MAVVDESARISASDLDREPQHTNCVVPLSSEARAKQGIWLLPSYSDMLRMLKVWTTFTPTPKDATSNFTKRQTHGKDFRPPVVKPKRFKNHVPPDRSLQ